MAPNLYCMLCHALYISPMSTGIVGSEIMAPIMAPIADLSSSSSYYSSSPANSDLLRQQHPSLHGGLTIEFVGELPFASCFPFLILDLSILLIQLALFCLNFSNISPPPPQLSPSSSSTVSSTHASPPLPGSPSARAMSRSTSLSSSPSASTSASGSRTSPLSATLSPRLNSSGHETSGYHALNINNNDGNNTISNSNSQHSDTDDDAPPLSSVEEALYMSYSGQLVVADIDIFGTLKLAWSSHLLAPGTAASTQVTTINRSSGTDISPNDSATTGRPGTTGSASATTYGATIAAEEEGHDVSDQDRLEGQQAQQQQQQQQQNQMPTLDPASTLARLMRNFS